EQANRYANGFLAKGIGRETKVAVMLPNCPEYLYCWFGLAKIGAVMVPINTAHKGDLLRYIIDRSDAEAVVTDAAWLTRLQEIESGLKQVRHIRAHGPTADVKLNRISVSTLSELKQSPCEQPQVEVRHSDPMTILFTSGTTGPSKGVVMSHHYYYH